MRIRVWRSDVCASDLEVAEPVDHRRQLQMTIGCEGETRARRRLILCLGAPFGEARRGRRVEKEGRAEQRRDLFLDLDLDRKKHTSELQSLMRISYAVFCLQKKITHK